MLCPKCFLEMPDDPALCSVSIIDGAHICTACGQIETMDKFYPAMAEGLRVGQKRAQAAVYGLNEHGEPNLPTETLISTEREGKSD